MTKKTKATKRKGGKAKPNIAKTRANPKPRSVATAKAAGATQAADAKAKNTAALRKLKPLADEINHRMKKGEENSVAVKLQFAKAQKICKGAGIPWQKWAEAKLKYSIRHINRVIAIETDKNPEQAQIAARKKHAEEERNRPRRTHVSRTDDTPAAANATDFTKADQLLARMTDKEQLAVAESRMGKLGYSVVRVEEYKALQAKAKKAGVATLGTDAKELMTSFLAMKAMDKVQFVKKAADFIDFDVKKRSEDRSNGAGEEEAKRKAEENRKANAVRFQKELAAEKAAEKVEEGAVRLVPQPQGVGQGDVRQEDGG